jgi:branched-chain amino acid transport system ATP-binding protein
MSRDVAAAKRPAEAGSLFADGVTVRFGAISALDSVSLQLAPREILGLIGPNGAGKTTLLNVLSGVQRPTVGTVRIGARDITALPVERRVRHGVARTFQAARLFPALTVAENIEVYASTLHGKRSQARRVADEMLEAGGLSHVAECVAADLPQGLERRVAMMRSLALHPDYLLLDEPAAGLDDIETDELAELIHALPARFGCGVLLVEHDMRLIMSVCHRIHVLNYGRTLSIGSPEEISADPQVRTAYLGGEGLPKLAHRPAQVSP